MDKIKTKAETKPTPKPSEKVKVYQLKVTLRQITPLIWRRILVKSDTSIAQMHSFVQAVMGWEDLHLHQFVIHGKAYGIYRSCGISFADDPHQVRLRDFKLRRGNRLITLEYSTDENLLLHATLRPNSNVFVDGRRSLL